ncbi:ABC transporter substrate-binding protein [Ruegeria sp. MALMAid1280]|uniref:ABC transporter substrate-binding protein n=1 Tax=Ruegeria sp. MALMAid1280 TaxID=3411634 RepID=UPI003B9F15F1
MLVRQPGLIDRRTLIKTTLASAALTSSLSFTRRAHAADGVIKIGYVSPRTGPLAAFAESDEYILAGINAAFSEGITIDGSTYGVEVIVKDSQSNPNRAADVAAQLILEDEVNLMVVSSTPETTNPVSDQCEINGVPCISTVAPWQPWFFTRGGEPETGFEYTYHFFWGLEDVIAVFTEMWGQLDTSKVVGGMFPNDGDGNAWGDTELGFPKPLSELGYDLIDPGRYQNLSDDFSAQISAFKNGTADIVTGVMIPPDFTTFWTQARQQGYTPKIASMGKAILFPVVVEQLGDAGQNLSSEVWWTPNHPFSSSLTGQSAAQVADGYTEATGRQWTQPIGFAHALFEVAADALSRSGDPFDYDKVRDAVAETKLDTVVGHIDFSSGPVPNVSKTPLVGGQWRLGGPFKYDMVITANGIAPEVPTGGSMEAIS